MEEVYADMPMDVAGQKLRQIENEYTRSNAQLMRETSAIQNLEADSLEAETLDSDTCKWNEYSIKERVYEIGKQAILSGLGTASNAIADSAKRVNTTEIGGIVTEVLENSLGADLGEVKAAIAGAVKTAAVNGVLDAPPADTATSTILR